MDKELVREIIASGSAMLTSMAQAAKTTGEHLYGVLIRQQLVIGISQILGVFIFIGLFSFLYKKIFRPWFLWASKKEQEVENDWAARGNYWMGFILGSLGVGAVTVLLTFMLSNGISHILNPEYYALEFIIESVKSQTEK